MYGIILLDKATVIVYIYKFTRDKRLIVLNTNTYDLTSLEPTKVVDAAQIVAVLMSLFLSHKSFIEEWRLISRGLPEEIVKDVAKTLDIPSEVLTLQREQELLCKAVVDDITR